MKDIGDKVKIVICYKPHIHLDDRKCFKSYFGFIILIVCQNVAFYSALKSKKLSKSSKTVPKISQIKIAEL